jgi:hypothetical protein
MWSDIVITAIWCLLAIFVSDKLLRTITRWRLRSEYRRILPSLAPCSDSVVDAAIVLQTRDLLSAGRITKGVAKRIQKSFSHVKFNGSKEPPKKHGG